MKAKAKPKHAQRKRTSQRDKEHIMAKDIVNIGSELRQNVNIRALHRQREIRIHLFTEENKR